MTVTISRPTVSAAWVKGIVELIGELGLEPLALLEEAGMPLDELDDADGRFDSAAVSVLWSLAAQQSGHPHPGVALGGAAKPACFGVVLHVMMSSPDLGSALRRMAQYVPIISSAARFILTQDSQGCGLTLTLGDGAPGDRHDFALLMIANLCRWLTGRDLRPQSVELAHARPANLVPYLAAFGCPCHFGAKRYRLSFSPADLGLPLMTGNPLLTELHERFANERLARLGDARTTRRVRELVLDCLADGEPARGDVARALCMSERTLQRRLQDEGTSYVQLVDAVRREQAAHYLDQTSLCFTEISYRLGFANQGTLFRACKRWFNVSPGRYRERHRAGVESA
ncbi:AraC family transcriptional regulator [Massilia sp. CCM 9210]|uniref:AraC family transcriptional regulator n=1 Tax=Massilia scottii TaxID=3057166 RepID=UPI00279667D7|nr:AraC family transcriptional regulator [Massilia sp. CCM 9210]MDQ1815941.1 AraC family transcriptional regulator [Massilia sp. CCM 9210]